MDCLILRQKTNFSNYQMEALTPLANKARFRSLVSGAAFNGPSPASEWARATNSTPLAGR